MPESQTSEHLSWGSWCLLSFRIANVVSEYLEHCAANTHHPVVEASVSLTYRYLAGLGIRPVDAVDPDEDRQHRWTKQGMVARLPPLPAFINICQNSSLWRGDVAAIDRFDYLGRLQGLRTSEDAVEREIRFRQLANQTGAVGHAYNLVAYLAHIWQVQGFYIHLLGSNAEKKPSQIFGIPHIVRHRQKRVCLKVVNKKANLSNNLIGIKLDSFEFELSRTKKSDIQIGSHLTQIVHPASFDELDI